MTHVQISIVGAGEMGLWFACFLKNESMVKIYDIDSEKTIVAAQQLNIQVAKTVKDLVKGCHLLIIATPIMTIKQVIEDLWPYLHPDMVLIDITAIKSPIVDILKKTTQLTKVLSIHPLFGPTTTTLQDKTIVLMSVTKDVTSICGVKKLVDLFTSSGAKIVEISLDDHDEYLSRTLNFSHFFNMAFAMTLRKSTNSLSSLLQFATTTFNAQLTLAEAVASENIAHYARLQISNPYTIKVLDQLLDSLAELRDTLSKNDVSAMVQILEENQEFLADDPNFSTAKDKMYKLLERRASPHI